MIVDCHTHWGIVWEDRDQGDPTQWLEIQDQYDIDKAFLLGHYNLEHSEATRTDNNRLAQIRDRFPAPSIPCGPAGPPTGGEGGAEIRRCLKELSMMGLKFHPWLQGFSTAHAAFADMCALAGEFGVPVLLHDGTPCYSLPEQVGGLARRFPETTFILGHAGLLWSWRSALETARFPNVWTCLCGPHLRAMELFCQRADTDRLLWGSDFGFGFSDPIGYRLNLIRRARIEDEVRKKILDANPLRLLASIGRRG